MWHGQIKAVHGVCEVHARPELHQGDQSPPKSPWQPRAAAVAHHWVTKTSKEETKRNILWREEYSLEAEESFGAGALQSDLRHSVGQAHPCMSPRTGDGADLCHVGVRFSSREIFAKC